MRFNIFLMLVLQINIAFGYDNCFENASKKYDVSKNLLNAIAAVESNHDIDAINVNINGSIDYGLMQINTFWIKKLKNNGINENNIMNPCLNIHIAAWILLQNFNDYGYNWNSVGIYNAGTSKKAVKRRKIYAKKIADTIGVWSIN